ncbi:hypothetical protein Tsubulata_031374 [Turnera subulata]|uniref:Uncharacterized protein n=1 Tax=Turnera subulata TaxID=218843 RepID=A0A9Q0GDU5_9ROSI|nr:hypothetical protein Tsubulata_031374 [Turnera subulata]
MKRQRSVDGHNTRAAKAEGKGAKATAVGKKKEKKAVEKVVEEERKNSVGGEISTAVMSQENLVGLEDQWPSWSVVDEQMSWGSIWLPIWDVEYMGEASHSEMFSDVAWDDDIWNLKGINTIPNN